jgi:serine/threonine-protein kinase
MSASTAITSPDPTACVPGELLGGKYRLLELLGEGGMGNVWLARNELLDMQVALKIVRPDARGTETTARLLTEARVQANLRHPNVARVFDYGQSASGDSFIVLELLEGCSLAELLEQRGALSPVHAVQLMLPIIDALCAAHKAGVIHRDLKPDNIFIAHADNQLCPKLLDFGIAKLEGDFQPRLTGNGGVIGSPAYMAPEQARGVSDIDHRVDVWAACVVLYESVTGKPAFDAENYHALLRNVIEVEPAPLTDPDCASLWAILQGGLMKDRARRTATMRELGAALARWLVEQGEHEELCREPLEFHWAAAARMDDPPSRMLTTGARPSRRALARREVSLPDRASLPATRISGVRAGTATVRPQRGLRIPQAYRMSVAAAVGGALLAFGLGQAWVVPESEPVAAHAAMLPVIAPAAKPAAPKVAVSEQPAAETQPKAPEQTVSAAPARPVARAPQGTKRAVLAAPPGEPAAEHSSLAAEAEPPAPRPQLTAADLLAMDRAPKAAAPAAGPIEVEPVRLTSTVARAVERAAAAPAPSETPRVRDEASIPKRSTTNEAELGLKSPW